MDVLIYASDMGSLDHRLADLHIGDRFIRHFNRYDHGIRPGGYEYASLLRISDGRPFMVRMDKLEQFFEVENDSAE